jgi:hypothetical protein
MKNHAFIWALGVLLTLPFGVNAQDEAPAEKNTGISLTLGSNYISQLQYYGRVDSLKSSALVPSLNLQLGRGFYLNSSFIFINNAGGNFQYNAAVAGAGFKFGKDNGFSGSVSADKFFFRNNELVQSVQTGQLGATLTYEHKIADLAVGGNAVFGDKTDYFANAGIGHRFRFETGNSVFVIKPSLAVNAGSQQFTQSYLVKRNVLILPVTQQLLSTTSQRFQVLSYEIGLPLVWGIKRWSVSCSPTYVLPQNVIRVEGRPDLSENTKDLFYVNVGIAFVLGKKD